MGDRPSRLKTGHPGLTARGSCFPTRASALALIVLAVGGTEPLTGQEPADTAGRAPQDTAAIQPAQAAAAGTGPADSVEVLRFPRFSRPDTTSPFLQKRWEHSGLLGTSALDVGELLEFDPALVPIRAGFFEGPQTHVFAGSGAPSLRALVDGYDLVPIGTAGYLDTHLLSTAEYDRVDLIRVAGGYQLEMDLFRRRRPQAYSRINGGTGDRDTNLIGGVFAAGFLGAPVAFSFDRVDSRGSAELGSMERNSLWAKLSHPLIAGVWGQVEFRRTIADRDSLIGTDRTDLILRFRRPFGSSWTADLIVGRASLTETPGDTVEQANGMAGDREFSATQVALRAGHRGEHWFGSASLRAYAGDGVPDLLNETTLGLHLGPLSLSGTGRHERWSGFTLYSGEVGALLGLPFGLHLGGEVEDGGRGLIGGSPPVRREFFTRLSAELGLSRGFWDLSVKGGRWRVDPSPALGAPFDSLMALGGGTVSVFEARATVPVLRLFDGQLTAGAYYQIREAGAFLYWPKDQWFLEGRYHNLALEDQLEIDLSARGGVRGPMLVSDIATDPTFVFASENLNWFRGELVVRIKDVHIFWTLEGFDSQIVNPFDVPGLVLPRSRSFFGLRWQFWN